MVNISVLASDYENHFEGAVAQNTVVIHRRSMDRSYGEHRYLIYSFLCSSDCGGPDESNT